MASTEPAAVPPPAAEAEAALAAAPAASPAPAAELGPGGVPRPPPGTLTAVTAERVVKQMEFYFSDSNLPRDKFMLERIVDNEEGYVDLSLIATFARMRDILKASARRARRASPRRRLLNPAEAPPAGQRGAHCARHAEGHRPSSAGTRPVARGCASCCPQPPLLSRHPQ